MFLTWSGAEASSHTSLCLCVPFLILGGYEAMLIIFEGLVCCLLVLSSCVVGIADGAHKMVFFYDKEVQKKVVDLGIISEEKIKNNHRSFVLYGILPYFVFVIVSVFVINKARGFLEGFLQLTAILLIEGFFDRLFIDWYWVNHTEAWIIPGTEELRPYISKKTWIRKWTGTLIGFPLIAAIIAGLVSIIIK